MGFILFLVFFISPPAKARDQVWSLQSTSTMEFATQKGCESIGKEIQDSFVKTATVTIRAWCFSQAGGATPDAKTQSLLEEGGQVIEKLEPASK